MIQTIMCACQNSFAEINTMDNLEIDTEYI